MISQDEIDQFEQDTIQELDRLTTALSKFKYSKSSDAADFVSFVEDTILVLIKKACNEKLLSQWALTHPVSAILFLNDLYQRREGNRLLGSIQQAIQNSDAYKILQAENPKQCGIFFDMHPISESHMRSLAVLDILNSPEERRENEGLFIASHFKTAVGDFQTIKQVWDVRDEARRRLVSQALIDHDFKTRAAALSIGCKSDGALAGNVRVLFGTPDYKRETIEPVIRGWEAPTTHPFQCVIESLVALKTLPKIEEQVQDFYIALLKRAAEKCQFVKVRMAKSLDISEKTVGPFMADLGIDEWYRESHKEFLTKTCEAVGYNLSQVATLLNVDVRYVTQQTAAYEILKSDGERRAPAPWPS